MWETKRAGAILATRQAKKAQEKILAFLACDDGWIEEAVVFPVADSNYILTQFQFSVEATPNSQAASTISPALWDLIRTHKFETLELTLTRGHWPFSSSPPIWSSIPPPGLELKVAFSTNTTTPTPAPITSNVELQALGHSLSSLIAASVPTLVEQGVWAAPAVGWWSSKTQTSTKGSTQAIHRRQLYGSLTQEGPCVENLSAWLKLLPCRGGQGAGLVSLLEVENFVAAPLHSLQLAIDTSSTVDTTSTADNTHNRVIKVNIGFTLLQTGNGKNILEGFKTMGAGVLVSTASSCPAALRTSILLPSSTLDADTGDNCTPIKPNNTNNLGENSNSGLQLCTLTSSPSSSKNSLADALSSVCSPSVRGSSGDGNTLWNLDVSRSMIPLSPQLSKLSLTATITTDGTTRSTIDSTTIDSTNSVLVHIMQLVPREVALRWHTLKLSFNGTPLQLDNNLKNKNVKEAGAVVVVWKKFIPAQPRGNAAVIEVLLQLPLTLNNATTTAAVFNKEIYLGQIHLEVEIKKKLLTIFDFPPDASRGIDVPAALVTLVPPEREVQVKDVQYNPVAGINHLIAAALGCKISSPVVVSRHTSPHLLNLPIPDASMPFNVVCFTSTVIALAFGSALNAILTKTPVKKDGDEASDDAQEENSKRKRAIKLRMLRVFVVLVTVGMTAVYMDKDLQRQVDTWLMELGAWWPSAPGSHHPTTEL